MTPAIALFVVFMVLPTINVFRMSLYKWGGFSNKRTFVGLNNFRILAEDRNFLQSFQNTVLLIVLVSIITITLALFFAAVLSREKIRGQNFSGWCFISPISCPWSSSALFSAPFMTPTTGF